MRAKEVQALSTGDPMEEFYKELEQVKDFHRRYPNEPIENLERAYKRRHPGEGEIMASETDTMFTGEESNGRFLDLTTLHEEYLNLPGIKRINYLQYLDQFDAFEPPRMPIRRQSKLSNEYLQYVAHLAGYLESFVRRTKPLEDLDKLFRGFERDFDAAWKADSISGWALETENQGPQTQGAGEGFWCSDCEKEFKNENVYKSHLTGKKHIRAAAAKKSGGVENSDPDANSTTATGTTATSADLGRLKERAIAFHEFRVKRLADHLDTERSNTRVNVERKQGMTEKERQQELEALFAEDEAAVNNPGDGLRGKSGRNRRDSDSDSDGGERIYNPLKLPLAWDGKPIPYWLYKLHGLGVEFSCEICGNFVYMGRRAFDKHFSEARHVYGLKCLGITGGSSSTVASGGGTALFREITRIDEALALWDKIKRERRERELKEEAVVQMEDGEGNVMPERIYLDLQKQGIL